MTKTQRGTHSDELVSLATSKYPDRSFSAQYDEVLNTEKAGMMVALHIAREMISFTAGGRMKSLLISIPAIT